MIQTTLHESVRRRMQARIIKVEARIRGVGKSQSESEAGKAQCAVQQLDLAGVAPLAS
jgi:hypothetical protein